jgi:hypothetical protein
MWQEAVAIYNDVIFPSCLYLFKIITTNSATKADLRTDKRTLKLPNKRQVFNTKQQINFISHDLFYLLVSSTCAGRCEISEFLKEKHSTLKKF